MQRSNGIPVPLLNPSVDQSVPSCTNQFYFFVQGIVKALQEYQKSLLEHKVSIFVRRGGPNYQEGLRVMREIGDENLTCKSGFQITVQSNHAIALVLVYVGISHWLQ